MNDSEDLGAEDARVALELPSGVALVDGVAEQQVSGGDLEPAETSEQHSWTVAVTSDGPKQVTVAGTGGALGTDFRRTSHLDTGRRLHRSRHEDRNGTERPDQRCLPRPSASRRRVAAPGSSARWTDSVRSVLVTDRPGRDRRGKPQLRGQGSRCSRERRPVPGRPCVHRRPHGRRRRPSNGGRGGSPAAADGSGDHGSDWVSRESQGSVLRPVLGRARDRPAGPADSKFAGPGRARVRLLVVRGGRRGRPAGRQERQVGPGEGRDLVLRRSRQPDGRPDPPLPRPVVAQRSPPPPLR